MPIYIIIKLTLFNEISSTAPFFGIKLAYDISIFFIIIFRCEFLCKWIVFFGMSQIVSCVNDACLFIWIYDWSTYLTVIALHRWFEVLFLHFRSEFNAININCYLKIHSKPSKSKWTERSICNAWRSWIIFWWNFDFDFEIRWMFLSTFLSFCTWFLNLFLTKHRFLLREEKINGLKWEIQWSFLYNFILK